jgi:CheY-like chemotaxis protein
VIALAGHSDQELVLEALRRGACDYLAKPVHDEELCLAIGRALAGYDALWRWQRVRERLARLADLGDAIAREAREGGDRSALAADAAASLAGLFGVSRAEAQHALETGGPPEAAAAGSPVHEEDRAILRLFAAAVSQHLAPEGGGDADAGEGVTEAAHPGDAASDLHVEMLREIAESATREVEPERLLAASLRPVVRAAGARAAGLFLIDNVTGLLAREACADGIDSERAELPRDRGLTGACLSSGAVVATDHPERDPRYDPDVDTPEGGAAGPLVVVPLQVRGRVLGVVRIFPTPEAGASARLAELVAAPLSAATRNVLLYRSLLESVEDVARARREAGTAGAPGRRT